MRIEIIAFDGVDELDAIAPYELLRTASGENPGWDVALVGATGAGMVSTAHGLRLEVTEGLGRPDALIVPGGGWGTRAPAGAWGEVQRGALPARIAELAPGCSWVASVCTGAMILAAAGLTHGRPATTHHRALDDLAATGAVVVRDARVVDDGNLITAAGVTSALDLALWIIQREMGLEAADRVADRVEHRRVGAVRTREQPSTAEPTDIPTREARP